TVSEDSRALLFDPQTSGGLLIAIAPEHAAALCADLQRRQIPAAQIGEVLPNRSPLIEVS
ncbi:MAG TPA: AIR synthase-related protein, partial [Candidatus Acidoferrales bacterium]|nr:AIR synthase-related protein [Candidatus Acidoferrales bacterium]